MKPAAVDTNVLVRLATGDNADEYQAAVDSLAARVWRVFPTVILETEWVLRSRYQFTPARFADFVEWLDASGRVAFIEADTVRRAVSHHRAGLDFADALHMAQASDDAFLTFDKALRRKAEKLGLRAKAVE
ncbi:MAG: type II toxin-antitoxin system VapC family toxin [Ottowia sp.]|uniref:type II toxin-antitoxin system VapC family toxin n=1 Tax=Ottowia sp. TaxID=1898956 RepID=UPI0039E3D06A